MVKVVVLIEWKGSNFLFIPSWHYQRHDYIVMVILCIDEYQNI